MNVSGVKSHIEAAGGEVTYTGYLTHGRDTHAHVEAYFEDDDEVPALGYIEACDRCSVDREWDSEHNGIMVGVEL